MKYVSDVFVATSFTYDVLMSVEYVIDASIDSKQNDGCFPHVRCKIQCDYSLATIVGYKL